MHRIGHFHSSCISAGLVALRKLAGSMRAGEVTSSSALYVGCSATKSKRRVARVSRCGLWSGIEELGLSWSEAFTQPSNVRGLAFREAGGLDDDRSFGGFDDTDQEFLRDEAFPEVLVPIAVRTCFIL